MLVLCFEQFVTVNTYMKKLSVVNFYSSKFFFFFLFKDKKNVIIFFIIICRFGHGLSKTMSRLAQMCVSLNFSLAKCMIYTSEIADKCGENGGERKQEAEVTNVP